MYVRGGGGGGGRGDAVAMCVCVERKVNLKQRCVLLAKYLSVCLFRKKQIRRYDQTCLHVGSQLQFPVP